MNTYELRQMLSRFPKAALALNPTPLHPLKRTQEQLGCGPLFIKRDDLNGIGIGGNKVRNLEYLLGDAAAKKKETIIVSGQIQSNLCALCAACCRRLNLSCVIVHNSAKPDYAEGNALLNRILGVEEIFLGGICEEERASAVKKLAQDLECSGRRPYIIDNGASTPVGALGYVEAAAELLEQICREEALSSIKNVCVPVGNGGLAAGFVYGTALLGNPFHVELISVEHEMDAMRKNILELLDGLEVLCGVKMPCGPEETATFHSAYRFGGWGVIDPAIEEFNLRFARTEGIFVEKVYTGKALYGVCDLARQGYFADGICYLHSGGIGALFSQYGREEQEE
jgi:1-aminocyclopropane-1-carboxylate deaminase/D-cysteine desulfhydrase/L-cysteate sulfo-lyase